MNSERVIYVPLYFLFAVVVACLVVGAVTGVAIISKFAVALFFVVVAMFVCFVAVVAVGCIWYEMSDVWKDDPEKNRRW